MKTLLTAALLAALSLPLIIVPARAEQVGFTRLTMADPMGGQMQVSLWYPTSAREGTVKLGPYRFKAARNAPAMDAAHGLVVISHGTEGSDLGHRNLALEMARRGLVVAAPLHPRDNFRDQSGVGRKVVMQGRPRQISAVIDGLLQDPDWGARLDPRRIGAFGFSLGGYSVLATLGAKPDMMRLVDHCEAEGGDPVCAGLGAKGGGLRKRAEQEFPEPMTGLHDPRICAASIADPLAVVFSDASLAGIATRFVRIWRPEHENVLSAQAHASRVVRHLNARPEMLETVEITVAGAQHYSFLAPFPWRLTWVLPTELTQDADGFDRVAFQARFAQEVADFMTQALTACAKAD